MSLRGPIPAPQWQVGDSLASVADPTRALLERTAHLAAEFLSSLDTRPVAPAATTAELRAALGGPVPDHPVDADSIIEELAAAVEPGVIGSPSGRFFGFVIGGALPAAVAADWLTSTWDQNAGLYAAGPSASVVEEVAGSWIIELLGLPVQSSIGFVTGCQMAHVTCLAAARRDVLSRAGWDVDERGLAGAPPLRVVTGANRHVTVGRALRLLGIGRAAVRTVDVDGDSRINVGALRAELAKNAEPTIVVAQAGEVNTGAFDDFNGIADAADGAGAWLHIDGAFGLWAAASPRLRHLVDGVARADSWATDGHKWLNVPYDSGLALCANADAHRGAMTVHADYLVSAEPGAARDELDWTPEFSRRARGFSVYAALRSLGRSGLADLVDRCCSHARRFADELGALPGAEILNQVVLNQVLLRFDDDATTSDVLRRVQASGEAWMSGTTWNGRDAIRISVSNWSTTDHDVDRTVQAFAHAVDAVR